MLLRIDDLGQCLRGCDFGSRVYDGVEKAWFRI